jgi:hypothetical protein
MRIFLFLVLIIFACTSCKEDKFTLFLKAKNASGLKTDAVIEMKGVQIGSVIDIKLSNDNQVIVMTEFEQGTVLPLDVEFRLQSMDFLGTMGIIAEDGEDVSYFSKKDTAFLLPCEIDNTMDSLASKMEDLLINNNPVVNKLDSLEAELEEINKKLNKEN